MDEIDAVMLKFGADANPLLYTFNNIHTNFKSFADKWRNLAGIIIASNLDMTEKLKLNLGNIFPNQLNGLSKISKGLNFNRINPSNFFPSFKKGGFVEHTAAYKLHKGEAIIPKESIARIIGWKNFFPSFKEGGVIPNTGLYKLHKNEFVVPEGESQQTTISPSFTININGAGLDARELAEKIKSELNAAWAAELRHLSRQ